MYGIVFHYSSHKFNSLITALSLPPFFLNCLKLYLFFFFQNQLRRFQASTFQPHTRTNVFITQMPLRLDPGWNKIEINLADFTHRAFGTRYMETVAIRINANVRLRRIYFSDQLYSEADKPHEYRLFVTDDKIPAKIIAAE